MPWRPTTLYGFSASTTPRRGLLLGNLREQLGIKPYASYATAAPRPARDIAAILDSPQNKNSSPRNVDLVAHVRSIRAQKRLAFVALGDGSTSRPLQALLDPTQASGLSTGTAVRVSGAWKPSPGQKQSHELHVERLELLGSADSQTFPIQKKYASPEFLRSIPHLRVRTTINALLARLRSETEHHLSAHFHSNGYVRLHPPAITSSDCEGAGEVFTVKPRDRQPRMAAAADEQSGAEKAALGQDDEFFKSTKYLTVSNQLHLEAFVHEHQRVWALAPTFRAERSDTPRHLSEFYMLEAELRCSQLDEVMDVVESMVKEVAKGIQGSQLGRELLSSLPHFDDQQSESARLETLDARYRGLRQAYWPRITYTQAIDVLRESAKDNPKLFSFEPIWENGLHLEHEKFIASTVGNGSPVFVTDYPKHQKPFYMLPSHVSSHVSCKPSSQTTSELDSQRWTPHSLPPKPSLEEHLQQAHPTVACFDLLLPDLGELVGGSMRENRFETLEQSMRDHSLANLEWYLDLRKYGSVPHGGFGLGFDRLLMYLSGVESVRDVVQWPRYYGKCDA